ncbi:MAG TPA: hypothetical protein PLN24_07715 [Victivallales bacterium]|nr:hypothetical protein [Victivallales bacterium]HPO90046.1 hypothetical protein [Victivallales bacterium]HRU02015.1 hypothetical protein [Victivallales bacterium]
MNSLVKRICTELFLFVFTGKIREIIWQTRLGTAKAILISLENLRVITTYLFISFIIIGMMGTGLALFVTGACILVSMRLMDPKLYELFLWIPIGFCFGGILCFLPAFLFIFFKFLSEKTWLNALKKNNILGKFLTSVLSEAEKRTSYVENSKVKTK